MDASVPQALGKNRGGYFGEPLDLPRFLRELDAAAQLHGWHAEVFYERGSVRLHALRKTMPAAARRVYLSAGIHGDEPAGPLAVLELVRANRWPDDLDLWICPCLNPDGLALNKRENASGMDLNRQYLHRVAAETQAHVAWLDRQPDFDLAICLHEDWEARGFYLYELNPHQRPSAAEQIIAAVQRLCPIDFSAFIEGRAAAGGIVRPSTDPLSRPEWPEAFYLLRHHGTPLSYTLEAPSDFALPTRVAALTTAVRTALGER